jgi:hypothetical protein
MNGISIKILLKSPSLAAIAVLLYWVFYVILIQDGYSTANHNLYISLFNFFIVWQLSIISPNSGPKFFWITYGVVLLWIWVPDLIGSTIGFGYKFLALLIPFPSFSIFKLLSEQSET